MSKQVRIAIKLDAPAVYALIQQAQAYFKANHIDQWQNGYPNEQVVASDVRAGACYVVEENGAIVATSSLFYGEEPTYSTIYEGAWHSNAPYAAIHRVAVDNHQKGSGVAVFLVQELEQLCRKQGICNLRIDTHENNLPMQKFLTKAGFAYCGVIYLEDGAHRLAFDKEL